MMPDEAKLALNQQKIVILFEQKITKSMN